MSSPQLPPAAPSPSSPHGRDCDGNHSAGERCNTNLRIKLVPDLKKARTL